MGPNTKIWIRIFGTMIRIGFEYSVESKVEFLRKHHHPYITSQASTCTSLRVIRNQDAKRKFTCDLAMLKLKSKFEKYFFYKISNLFRSMCFTQNLFSLSIYSNSIRKVTYSNSKCISGH